jgi:putative sigma-54 modulation protein
MRQQCTTGTSPPGSGARERFARSRVPEGATAATPSMAPHADSETGPARSGPKQKEYVMQINVKGHQVEVTEALNNYAIGKFERVTRVFDQLHDVSVVLGVEKLLHKAEVTMQLSGKTLHADATAPDMYAAIDVLVDKVETQLRKHKEKLTDHHADAVRAARYS